jgi:hypothetical protein
MNKVFISYSHKDQDWVKNWLLKRLEQQELQTHIDYRDFEIGVPSVVNMERAVEHCAKTLLFFTPNWIYGEWAQFEGIMLQTLDPMGQRQAPGGFDLPAQNLAASGWHGAAAIGVRF